MITSQYELKNKFMDQYQLNKLALVILKITLNQKQYNHLNNCRARKNDERSIIILVYLNTKFPTYTFYF